MKMEGYLSVLDTVIGGCGYLRADDVWKRRFFIWQCINVVYVG